MNTKMLLVAALFCKAALAGPDTLVSGHVSGPLPLDPESPLWEKAKPVTATLAGQTVTTPRNPKASISQVTVQSLNDGKAIAFRLTWKDPTEDRFHTIDRFSDAIAVQVPYEPSQEVPITMGSKGKRVLILHWAAFRQENIDHGYSDTAKIYPNYAFDWYPHAKPPYRYPEDWHNQYALNYVGGEKVFRKNTLKTPVREVVAEGFGSSTWKDIQGAEGKGIYKDGRWEVVIRRRFVEENTSNPQWGPGTTTYVTFAAWDGAHGERGARKSLGYAWLKLRIEGR